ncbi:hypothetical protein HDU67_001185 [Dinochytrium kinnereticum]|nr:hypothetical protein HDU67_001185 [Dinochytrium kinnereticum]
MQRISNTVQHHPHLYPPSESSDPRKMSDSVSIPVDQLAAEARKDEKKSIFPPVPIAVLITFIVLVALGAVAAPLGAILGTTSQSSIDSLSGTVLSQSVDLVFVQVQDKILQPRRMMSVLMDDKTVENAMLNNFNNLVNETALYFMMYKMTMSSSFLSGVSCVTYPNLFGRSPPGPFGPNSTFVSAYRLQGGANIALWADWSTGGFLVQSPYNPATNRYDLNITVPYAFPWNVVLLNTAFYNYMFTNPIEPGVAISSVSQMKFIDRVSTSHPAYSCSFGFENEGAMGQLFKELQVTPNAKLFLFDSVSESLLANSVPYTLYSVNYTDPLKTVTQFTVSTTNDTMLRDIGEKLRSIYGNFTRIPNKNGTTTLQTDVNGQKWYISTRYLTEPSDWLLVVAIPRSDFFGEIDAASKKVIAICVSIALIGIALIALISFFSLQPLSKLSKAMESLTKLDFSALEGNILNDRSGVLEVRKLQLTFAIMCKAFASGIRKNKALVGGATGAATMKSSMNPSGSQNTASQNNVSGHD